MSWKNQPDLWQLVVLAISTGIGVLIGTLTRIFDQVREGQRERFFTRRLLVDGLGCLFIILICLGVAEYFALGTLTTVAVSVVLGRAGPPAIDRLFDAFMASKERSR